MNGGRHWQGHSFTAAVPAGRWLKLWQADLFAIAATAGTLGLRLALNDRLDGQPALVIFALPIMLSAYLGGLRAGLVATAFAFLGASYYLLPPLHSFAVASRDGRWQQVFVALAGVCISALCEALHRARRHAEIATREQRQAVETLRLSETAQLHLSAMQLDTLNALPAHIALLDAQGVILSVNDAWRSAMANVLQGPEFAVGQNYLEVCTRAPGDGSQEGEDAARGIRQVLRGAAKVFALEYPCHSLTEQCWFRLMATPLQEGRLSGAVVMHIDITERKEAAAVQRRLAAIVNSSDDAIIGKTLEGIITSWNPGAEKVFGYSAAEVVGKPMLMLFPPERVQEEVAILARIRRGESVRHFETVRVRKDGRLIDVSVTISPITDSAGQIIGASKIARDITEQKRADLALRESEARKAAVLETALDCLITMDRDGRIVEFNPAAERTFGHSRSAAIGTMMADLIIPPAWRERHQRGFAHYLATGEGAVLGKLLELPALRADGSEFPAEIAINVMEVNGRPMFTASLRDITERVQAAAALREREESFRTMANSIPQLAWNARADGFIFWYNQRWYDYTGTTPEQMEGWGWQSVHDPQVLPRVMELWTAAIAAGEPFDMEFPLRGADGNFRPFLTRALPLKDTEGKVVQWFGTNTDVDELKRVEDSLRKSEASLADAQARAKMGNWELDFATQTGTWSAEMFRLFDRDPALGVPSFAEFKTLPHPDDRESFARLHAAAVAAGRPYEQDFRVLRPDGSIRWIAARAELILDSESKPVRMIGTSQDITERKTTAEVIQKLNMELELRVVQRTAQLEAANQELEAFSYSVSHDLRAPLRGVNGYVSMIREDYADRLDAEGNRLLQVVASEARRMGQLIDDLLAFSRLGRQTMGTTLIDMTSLVRGEFENLTRTTPESPLRFELQSLPRVHGDSAMLRQVFANLLANAIKFSRQRSHPMIEVGSRSGEGEIIFYVKDNGAGFDQRYRHKLFGVFQRLHSEEEFEGTGVGLALVQRVIHRHGGRVWAESTLNQGATFYCTLPN